MSYDTVQLSMYSCSRVFIWLIVFFCRGEEGEKINKRRKLHSSALGLTRGRSLLRGPWTSLILIDVHDFLFRKKITCYGGDTMVNGKKRGWKKMF